MLFQMDASVHVYYRRVATPMPGSHPTSQVWKKEDGHFIMGPGNEGGTYAFPGSFSLHGLDDHADGMRHYVQLQNGSGTWLYSSHCQMGGSPFSTDHPDEFFPQLQADQPTKTNRDIFPATTVEPEDSYIQREGPL